MYVCVCVGGVHVCVIEATGLAGAADQIQLIVNLVLSIVGSLLDRFSCDCVDLSRLLNQYKKTGWGCKQY